MPGGRTNHIWRVESDQAPLVVKLYIKQAGTPLFPNDDRAEYAVLQHLAGSGLAPHPVAHVATAAGPCVIYRHVPGSHSSSDPAGIGAVLRHLHRIAPPAGLRHVASGSAAILRKGDEILAQCEDDAGLRAFRPKLAVGATADPVFLHGDPVPANILATAQGSCLIDWQCPAVGDRCEDLAICLSPAMRFLYGGQPLGRENENRFLQAYGDPATVARYRALAPAFHWRMAAYCQWRAQRREPDNSHAKELELSALRALA
ncbi:aminoglycoside phosphotransferase family protein [Lutimaribacter sp. EGI FJ00013]|uniref:Aminoglycoside phosphotransferase family protein n=2 Tax=Lutimaribacter degradans TaxID=2945989 RepID=A0ACC5ZWV4_9RHOB|nr:aminoglycoside phosphotransferase family protein [Lutimaribacter sp. EGI FJ00013]MCM2561884.1 aminoglycoside phosphotransferase family protein [Lutimaribacter sp. EGI FJ00013]